MNICSKRTATPKSKRKHKPIFENKEHLESKNDICFANSPRLINIPQNA